MDQDAEHLRLLSIFHYVFGGITAFFALFPIFHLLVGLFFLLAPEGTFDPGPGEIPPRVEGGADLEMPVDVQQPIADAPVDQLRMEGDAPTRFIGWMFVILSSTFILFGLTMATLILATGRALARRQSYTFCLVVAGIECLFMPVGTVLGVFTIIVLQRESVKRLFGQGPALPPPVPQT